MRRASRFLISLIVLLVILVAPVGGAAPAAPLAAAAPTVVSYQGQVKIGGTTYDGAGYFKFAIVDGTGVVQWSNAPMSGDQPNAAVNLTVSKGLFNVLLGDTTLTNMTQALTSAAFTGAERYLRVWFSSTGSGFVVLSPDRRIAAVPYALRAEKEGNVITVAKSGGDFTSVQAALDSITDAGAANPYLIRVAPGVYDGRVTMKSYVDIEGSGEAVTKLTRTTDYYSSQSGGYGTLVGADNAEARFLTIEAKGDDGQTSAVKNVSASPKLTHVTLIAEAIGGRPEWGAVVVVHNQSAAPVLTDVTVSGDVKGWHYDGTGIYNQYSATVMNRVKVTVTGGTRSNTGVDNYYMLGSASPVMRDSVVTATGGGAGTTNRAVYNRGAGWSDRNAPVMTNVTAMASGASGASSYNYGVDSITSMPVMTNVIATASGGADSSNAGVYNHWNSTGDLRYVVARAEGGVQSIGVRSECDTSKLTWVTASASGGSSYNYGVHAYNYGDAGECRPMALPTLINVTATASGGSLENRGVSLGYSNLPATVSGLVVTVSGNAAKNWGLYIYGVPMTVHEATINASDADGCGVVVGGSSTTKINNSEISGTTNTIKIYDSATIYVGGSLMAGGPVSGSPVTCAGVYDEAYTFYPNTCP